MIEIGRGTPGGNLGCISVYINVVSGLKKKKKKKYIKGGKFPGIWK